MSVNYTSYNGYISPITVNTTGTIGRTTVTTNTVSTTGHVGNFSAPSYSFQWTPPKHIVEFRDGNGNPIVTLENDGSVTWHQENAEDEAVKAFGNLLTISVEQKASVTQRVKDEIFDQVFHEIYQVFKDRDSITGEELRIAYESSKIFRKLRGDK